MTVLTLNCYEEAIHLCGKIQSFGYLIIFNLDLNCIAVSENCSDWLHCDTANILNKDIYHFLPYFKSSSNESFILHEQLPSSLIDKTTSYKIILNNKTYQLTIYTNNNKIFFEFEENEKEIIHISQLNDFQLKLDQSEDTWQVLVENIRTVTGYDRVMVYQFLEDSSGIVIAEKTSPDKEKLLGYRYPEFDIPQQARQLYEKNHSRQVHDIYATTSNIIGLEPSNIDLSHSQIRALSPIHLQYLENFGVRASASFSIIIENKLWGLVTCQNFTPKYIPYDYRYLCLVITQYAASKYLVKKERKFFLKQQDIKELEINLKERLYYNKSWEDTLMEFAEDFMVKLSAHGMIIKSANYFYTIGKTPNKNEFDKIHAYINKNIDAKNIYTTHNFTYNEPLQIDHSNWAGIARISFDDQHNSSVYWFREEIKIAEKWAGIPQKYPIYCKEKNVIHYSPRTSFQLWLNEVKGQSEKWSLIDQGFIIMVEKLIRNSILQKIIPVKQLNEKLIEVNNRLETYTHQLAHDLKNPLTEIKIKAQFIQIRKEISREKIYQFSKNIADATTLINEIINKTLESTKATPDILPYEYINTDIFINQLINQALENYKIDNYKVDLGELLPIYGEKTLLFQLFMNLINNAIKFSSKQQFTRISIDSFMEENNTIYHIKDNGIGISEEEKPHIFSIFKRLSNAQEFEGDGIGMSIVKRIVDKLQAKISIDSHLGIGTTFKISFPNE